MKITLSDKFGNRRTTQTRGGSTNTVIEPPAGTIIAYAASGTAPSGWLKCDGSAVSRTTYASLFSVVSATKTFTLTNGSKTVSSGDTTGLVAGMQVEGTGIPSNTAIASITNATSFELTGNATSSGSSSLKFFSFGNGDGSTTFNVPDMRGRVPVGAGQGSGADTSGTGAISGGSSTTNFAVGSTGGFSELALWNYQVASPGHSHTLTENPHTHGITETAHSHNIRYQAINTATGQYNAYSLGGSSYVSSRTGSESITVGTTTPKTAGSNVSSAFSVSSVSAIDPAQSAHTNLQPTLVVGSYLIKT